MALSPFFIDVAGSTRLAVRGLAGRRVNPLLLPRWCLDQPRAGPKAHSRLFVSTEAIVILGISP